jgi:hypothetical protein
MSLKYSNGAIVLFCLYCCTVLSCTKVKFLCLGRNFWPLELVEIHDIGSNGNFNFTSFCLMSSDNVIVAHSDSPHYQSRGSAVVSQTAEQSWRWSLFSTLSTTYRFTTLLMLENRSSLSATLTKIDSWRSDGLPLNLPFALLWGGVYWAFPAHIS